MTGYPAPFCVEQEGILQSGTRKARLIQPQDEGVGTAAMAPGVKGGGVYATRSGPFAFDAAGTDELRQPGLNADWRIRVVPHALGKGLDLVQHPAARVLVEFVYASHPLPEESLHSGQGIFPISAILRRPAEEVFGKILQAAQDRQLCRNSGPVSRFRIVFIFRAVFEETLQGRYSPPGG
jgi:hypothetical protein